MQLLLPDIMAGATPFVQVLDDYHLITNASINEALTTLLKYLPPHRHLVLLCQPLADAEQLELVAFAGYLAGLLAAGWAGDEAAIWEAYGGSMPLRYAPVSVASMLRTAVAPTYASEWEQKTGRPLTDILGHRAGLVRFYLTRLETECCDAPTLIHKTTFPTRLFTHQYLFPRAESGQYDRKQHPLPSPWCHPEHRTAARLGCHRLCSQTAPQPYPCHCGNERYFGIQVSGRNVQIHK